MVKSSASFLIGIACGAAAVLLVQRLREVTEEVDADILIDRITDSLAELEARAQRFETSEVS